MSIISKFVETSSMPFIHDDFLLTNDKSRKLYHDYARSMPIIDYHNHLNPEQLAKNHQFADITELWLAGDHYKWRAMRANGVEEKFITGDATSEEKFQKWSETVPFTLGNPLFHWTHLELQRYFEVDELLNAGNAQEIFQHCNARLKQEAFKARNLVVSQNVEVLCTTDDPTYDLSYHQMLRDDQTEIRVFPT